MKKKSYDEQILYIVCLLSLISIVTILSFLLRSVSIPANFGSISLDIPVLNVPLQTTNSAIESNKKTISDKSPMIVFDHKKIYFGTISSFGKELINYRNKFLFESKKESDTQEFIKQYEKWLHRKKIDPKSDKVVLLFPKKDIPMGKVISFISLLKDSNKIDKVVLGGGIL